MSPGCWCWGFFIFYFFFEVREGHLAKPLSSNVLCDPTSQTLGSDFRAHVPLNAGADGEVVASLETNKAKPTRETQEAHQDIPP